jgi:hypothetical protein
MIRLTCARVPAGEFGRQRGSEQVGFWRKLLAHPSYGDAFWKIRPVDKILAAQPLSALPAGCIVCGIKRIAMALIVVYKALKTKR